MALTPTLEREVQTLIRQGEKAAARRRLARLAGDDSGDARVWYLLSLCAGDERQYRTCLNKALDIDPALPEARKALVEYLSEFPSPLSETTAGQTQYLQGKEEEDRVSNFGVLAGMLSGALVICCIFIAAMLYSPKVEAFLTMTVFQVFGDKTVLVGKWIATEQLEPQPQPGQPFAVPCPLLPATVEFTAGGEYSAAGAPSLWQKGAYQLETNHILRADLGEIGARMFSYSAGPERLVLRSDDCAILYRKQPQ